MSNPYLCPNCKTNRTRFNLIEQVATPVKMNPKNGEIVETYENNDAGPFHLLYHGPDKRIQCAACGLIENEKMFIKRAQN